MFDGLRHIKAFLTVARLRNITRASDQLHVSQPALSVQIQQLETSLGVTLFERNKSQNRRQIALTASGKELVVRLERILADAEAIMTTCREFTELRRGTVNVATMPSIASAYFPRAIQEFSEMFPGVVVRLKDSMGKEVAELVKAGAVDFGVGCVARKSRIILSEHLCTERICAVVANEHSLSGRATITLRELTKHRILLPEMNTSVRFLLDRALEKQGLSLRPVHETGHLSETIGMVNAGLGVAILPECITAGYPSSNLKCIAITEPILEREVLILGKKGRPFSAAVQKLIEILRRVSNNGILLPQ